MRVIAGEFRGRRLIAPPGTSTRPTSDRVREALFSILGDISGARVLDLFAGSGALGIEALSRGAEDAVFVESSRRAAEVIRANLRAVGDPQAKIRVETAIDYLSRARGEYPFDLVFVDPPYSSATQVGGRLSELLPGFLSETSRTVTESDKRAPLQLDLTLVDERVYGDTRIAIHRGR
ncbi:MAG: rRNA (guanine966-N2)-methyltransferase [Thermoleophilaceae bacterium]|jgi:16S rRNA (guanine966-N2)-methyltransferase|nr:rRNA (guanine966-N2)-methyltransferase [Thermoleophilaceae bacterium]